MAEPTKSVSVIIPTRNEVENIRPLLEQIAATGVPLQEVIFVDDYSSDGTREAILSMSNQYPVRLLDQEPAVPGLAGAIISGADAATSDVLLVMDADLSHPPERIPDLLRPIMGDVAKMVIGSRYVPGGSTPDWPLWRRSLSRTASALAYPLTGVHDSMSGFFAIGRAEFIRLDPPPIGFKIAFELLVRGKPSLRVREVPIEFRDRQRGRSKMSFGIALRFFWRWLIALALRMIGTNRGG
jgi:dolichol-phosphate mannosyltransferase